MERRTLLRWMASMPALLPLHRAQVFGQSRELTPEAVAVLHDIAPTVLPGAIGADRIRETTDKFVAWTRGYREGVALAHGYGHPRLQKSGASPVPRYVSQLATLDAAARTKGQRWSTLDRESQRALLDAAFVAAGVRTLPQRPIGQHVVADLMAFYFRSSEANNLCYSAMIDREVCRPIAITTKRPDPLR
jgi:hypothetical protein